MALRAGMLQLISRVRALIDSPAGNAFTFTNEQVQEALDRRRQEHRYLVLDALPTKTSASTTYLTFQAPDGLGDWDMTTALYDNDFDVQSPATSDFITGRWTFSSEPTRPITLVGFTYDRYAAAADLLEEALSMGLGDATFRLSVLELITVYRKKQRPFIVDLVRSDLYA